MKNPRPLQLPWPERINAESQKIIDAVLQEAPPPGTVRKVESDMNEIIVWPNGDLTLIGGDAWRLYIALQNFRFHTDFGNDLGIGTHAFGRNMRHLLEHIEPCDDVRPQLEQALRVEAALLSAEFDWPHFTCGPVAIRKATPSASE